MTTGWLTTDRLSLRPPTPDDLDVVFDIHRNPLTSRHLPSAAMTRVEQAAGRLAEWLSHWADHGFGYAVVSPTGSDRVLGFTGPAHATLLDRPVLNLYYRYDPDAWGHGYAVEAAAAVADWCRAHHPDLPLVARVATNNPASLRVAERAGLVRQPVIDPTDPLDHLLLGSLPLEAE